MVYIENSFQLWEDYTYYKNEYPNSYTTKDDLIKSIFATTQEDEELVGVGWSFGLSISDERENRCYEFEIVELNEDRVLVKYVGIACI